MSAEKKKQVEQHHKWKEKNYQTMPGTAYKKGKADTGYSSGEVLEYTEEKGLNAWIPNWFFVKLGEYNDSHPLSGKLLNFNTIN